jgi:hypothetical protein
MSKNNFYEEDMMIAIQNDDLNKFISLTKLNKDWENHLLKEEEQYLIHYAINGIAQLKRNGQTVPGINSALVDLNFGDIISLVAVSLSGLELDDFDLPTASITFIKL